MKMFISSTSKDLGSYRKCVSRILRALDITVIGVDDFPAIHTKPLNKCIGDVRSSDIYLLIVAWRYGYIPDEGSGGRSITELEYQAALRANVPCLIFLLNPELNWPVEYIDKDRSNVVRFRSELENNHVVKYFDSADSLIEAVISSIGSWGSSAEANYSCLNKNIETNLVGNSLPPPFDSESNLHWLRNIYENEVENRLKGTDIFTKKKFSKILGSIENDPSFVDVAGLARSLVHKSELDLHGAARLGVDCRSAKDFINRNPMHFVVSPAHAGSLSILYYIKYIQGVNITFNFHMTHSVDILNCALKSSFVERVDGFTLTVATAGILIRENISKYTSSLLMPSISHGLISPLQTKITDPLDGEYLLMKDTPSSELFVFNDLRRNGILSKSVVTEAEPDEVTFALRSGGGSARSIIGFPHYKFNEKFNGSILLGEAEDFLKPVLLFLDNERTGDLRVVSALSTLIRNAWVTLVENQNTLKRVVSMIVNDYDYVRTLCRITGINRLNAISSGARILHFDDEANLGEKLGFSVVKTTAEKIISLRHVILRFGYSVEEVKFKEDSFDSTLHYAIFDDELRPLACVTMIRSIWNGKSAWQLRAMACALGWQRKGLGRKLLVGALEDMAKHGVLDTIWCNARVSAELFYRKMGWRDASLVFVNGNAGPSKSMVQFFKREEIGNEFDYAVI